MVLSPFYSRSSEVRFVPGTKGREMFVMPSPLGGSGAARSGIREVLGEPPRFASPVSVPCGL